MGIALTIELGLNPRTAFEVFVEELVQSLELRGFTFDPRENGLVLDKKTEGPVGKVQSWQPPDFIELEWFSNSWTPEKMTTTKIAFAPASWGMIVQIKNSGWNSSIFEGDEKELIGWAASVLVAPFLVSTHHQALGDWVTDRRARRPSGSRSRSVYGDPVFHRPNFGAILKELSLKPDDYLLEIGCGGGIFLQEALESGCRAAGIDHSPDMIRLASETNGRSISQGRLVLKVAEADAIPFPDTAFSCASMTGVLLFLPDALLAFKEIYRVLKKGGRFVLFTGSKETRGT